MVVPPRRIAKRSRQKLMWRSGIIIRIVVFYARAYGLVVIASEGENGASCCNGTYQLQSASDHPSWCLVDPGNYPIIYVRLSSVQCPLLSMRLPEATGTCGLVPLAADCVRARRIIDLPSSLHKSSTLKSRRAATYVYVQEVGQLGTKSG